MLRINGKTTLLAGALVATASFLFARNLVAQEMEVQQEIEVAEDCPDGAAVGASGHLSGGTGICGLHGPTVNCRPQYYGQPELFYNYYIPGTCGGVPANMYLAPQPVPAWVGHTYYTYQPFMPHELLYQHHRSYYRYYNGGRGMTRAHVSWSRPPFTGWTSSLRIAR